MAKGMPDTRFDKFCRYGLRDIVRPDLALIRTCRKIHHEAALLVFNLNTIHCESVHALGLLPRSLNSRQCHTIQEMYLAHTSRSDKVLSKYLSITYPGDTHLGNMLPGLKSITVYPSGFLNLISTEQRQFYKNKLERRLRRFGEDLKITWIGYK
jgi:hypothetical protein